MTASHIDSQPAFQPDDHPSIQQFLQWKNDPSVVRTGCSGPENDIPRNYISFKTLKKKLTKPKVEELLKALFESGEKAPPDANTITKHYLRPFAILLCIGAGRMVQFFEEHEGLQDHHLPFRNEPHIFPQSTTRDLFAAFREEQWVFCAVSLEFDLNLRLEPEDILPIVHKEKIEEGGSAVAYKIVVDEDYDGLLPSRDQYNSPQLPRNLHQNTYVIKTYHAREGEKYYDTERNAFKKIRIHGLPPPNIIAFYGSFVRGEACNIILEYADLGHLDEFMARTAPPLSSEDKVLFWDRFFNVGDGLMRIHNGGEDDRNDSQISLGWHQDVNPANIFVMKGTGESPYDCHFKLADLGLSHFKKHVSQNMTDNDTWGTKAYGAPETRRNDENKEKSRLKVKQDVDIWSMGCIFSEAATWVDQGWIKVIEYRRHRSEEMKDKTGARRDCFHDGWDVLDTVKTKHSHIMKSRRADDFITPTVVSNLIDKMLLVGEQRLTATQTYEESKRIITNAKAKFHEASHRSYSHSFTLSSVEGTAMQTRPAPYPLIHHNRQLSGETFRSQGSEVNQGSRSQEPLPSPDDLRRGIDAYVIGGGPLEDYHHESYTSNPPLSPQLFQRGDSSTTLPKRQEPDHVANVFHRPPPSTHSSFNAYGSFPQSPQVDENAIDLMGESNQPSGTEHRHRRDTEVTNSQDSIRSGPSIFSGDILHNPIIRQPSTTADQLSAGDQIYQPASQVGSRTDLHLQLPQGGDQAYRPASQVGSRTDLPLQVPQAGDQMYRPASQVGSRTDLPLQSPQAGDQIYRPASQVGSRTDLPIQSPQAEYHTDPISTSSNRVRPPDMSVREGLRIKYARLHGEEQPWIEEEGLLEALKDRDHAFLIDNSETMAQYRAQLRDVLDLLSYMVGIADSDSLDLHFTNLAKGLKLKNNVQIVKELDSRAPAKGRPDMRARFARIVGDYQDTFGKPNVKDMLLHPKSTHWKKPRRLTLYVLTDGIWQPKTTLQIEIRTLVGHLLEERLNNKQIGIQFIQFGKDPTGTERLKYLDSRMGLELDVVDNTPADGNVWKMLLGSISDWFDDGEKISLGDEHHAHPYQDSIDTSLEKGKNRQL